MFTIKELEDRVDAGIELLNSQVENWCQRIDLDTFDLGAARLCVLGQVYGDDNRFDISGYSIGFNKLGLSGVGPYAYGFDLALVEYKLNFTGGHSDDAWHNQWAYLVWRWTQRISQCQEEEKVVTL